MSFDFWRDTARHGGCGLPSPCYIFDADILGRTARAIREALPACQALCFAMKANPFLTGCAEGFADRFEVCSPGEFEICHAQGIEADRLILSGVYKTRDFVLRAMTLLRGRGLYTAESRQQYDLLCSCAAQLGLRPRVLIRLSSGNQFGVDEQTLEQLLQHNQQEPVCSIQGIHYYSGTQKRMKKIRRELEQLDALAADLKERYHLPALELEYGPGLTVDYFGNDKLLPPLDQLRELNEALASLTAFDAVGIELGRFLAAPCGCFLTQVGETKTSRGIHYAILDSGIHQLHYFGQMMGMEVPPLLPVAPGSSEEIDCTLCGALCTVNDVLVRSVRLPRLSPGDRLLFQLCGAYSVTEGSALFLSRELPAVWLYSEKTGYTLLRDRFETCCLNSGGNLRKEL